MKLKIKLKNINEAIETPALDAVRDREAEKASNEFDADEMEKEIEKTVTHQTNREDLEEILKEPPEDLEMIKELLGAHGVAVQQQYNFDNLFEKIEGLLSSKEVARAGAALGVNLNVLQKVGSALADAMEDWHEEIVKNLLNQQMVDRATNEALGSDDKREIEYFKSLANDPETSDEAFMAALKNRKIQTGRKLPIEYKNTKQALNQLVGATNILDTDIAKAIDRKAKKGEDVAAILVGADRSGNIVKGIKGAYISVRVLEQFAKHAMGHFKNIAVATKELSNHPDPKFSIDQIINASEDYSEAYKSFNIKNVINQASGKFNERMFALASVAQDKITGGHAAKLRSRAEKFRTGDVSIDEILSPLQEALSKEDYNTIYSLALYKNKSMQDIETLSNKFTQRDKIDPEGVEKQLFRIIEYFEREFKISLIKVTKDLNRLKKHPKFVNQPDIINKIDTLLDKFENGGDKDKFNQEFLTVNKLMNSDPKAWSEQFKDLIKRIKEYPNQLKKDMRRRPAGSDQTKAEKVDPNSLKGMSKGKINVALNQLRQKGISSKDLTIQIDTAVNTISKNAGPQRRNFKERDLPVINKIKDELTKILDGDFSNLIKEAQMGQLPERYIEKILVKWLQLKNKYSPESLNKAISFIELSEEDRAKKLLIKMIKDIKENKEFELTDQWQEVPKDTIMPPGAEYKMDLANQKTYARIIKENCKLTNNSNIDLSQLENIVAQFYPYVKEKLKFNKDVNIDLISDPENAKDPWGKTAYYDPDNMKIVIFADNRHPKDMLRSLSHELVHHAQNCRGEFDQKQALEPGYAQKDPHMRRMEGEAYLLGNGFLVRDFEDYLKSQQNQNLTENKKMSSDNSNIDEVFGAAASKIKSAAAAGMEKAKAGVDKMLAPPEGSGAWKAAEEKKATEERKKNTSVTKEEMRLLQTYLHALLSGPGGRKYMWMESALPALAHMRPQLMRGTFKNKILKAEEAYKNNVSPSTHFDTKMSGQLSVFSKVLSDINNKLNWNPRDKTSSYIKKLGAKLSSGPESTNENKNLTENKKMKGLTNKQLRTVLENTIKRVMKEDGFVGPVTKEPADIGDEEVIENNVVKEFDNPEDAYTLVKNKCNDDHKGDLDAIKKCMEAEGMTESLNETFTSKKDHLLFERLTKKWTK